MQFRGQKDRCSHDHAWALTVGACRVLVIDDEPGIRRFASRALRSAGFAVEEATGGHEGLSIALSDTHDLVLLDLGCRIWPERKCCGAFTRSYPIRRCWSGRQRPTSRYRPDA